ncbi:zinc-ribbon domain-containing protein [Ulvibacterium sp.]|uniref:zinc-ribbon domain-containing protein n=1 Tax=Ulvibacterium sp. TaxID=2665914 RepID=UPI003BAD2DD5
MILFLGTRPGKTEIKRLSGVRCPFCNQTGTLTVSRTSNYFHLFWVKLFKISTSKLAECSHCKRVYYQNEFTPEMENAIGID